MPTPKPFEHGMGGYRKGCKCDVCRAANALRYMEDQRDRCARLKADPSIRPHGDPSTYHNWGCRCIPCTKVTRPWAFDTTTPPPAASGERVEERRKLRAKRERLMHQVSVPKPQAQPFGREWAS